MVDRFFYLRLFVALLLVGFAYFLGRSLAQRHQPGRRGTGPTSWGLRMVVATLGVTWGVGFDIVAIGAFAVSALAAVAGYAMKRRPRKIPTEDLTKEMFPDD